MRRPGLATWLAAGALVLGAVACFKDPTSSLRSGASRLQLNRSFAQMAVAESLDVTVQVLDNQGNYFSFDAPQYTVRAGATASLIPLPTTDTATIHIPGNTLWKAKLIGKAVGTTYAVVTAAGISDSIKVIVQ